MVGARPLISGTVPPECNHVISSHVGGGEQKISNDSLIGDDQVFIVIVRMWLVCLEVARLEFDEIGPDTS